jgi:hypothetical protein
MYYDENWLVDKFKDSSKNRDDLWAEIDKSIRSEAKDLEYRKKDAYVSSRIELVFATANIATEKTEFLYDSLKTIWILVKKLKEENDSLIERLSILEGKENKNG